jgi:hypothetical protein
MSAIPKNKKEGLCDISRKTMRRERHPWYRGDAPEVKMRLLQHTEKTTEQKGTIYQNQAT